MILRTGVDLSALKWQPAGGNKMSAKLPSPPSWRFESLYYRGQRQWRARWPNGNPETYCKPQESGLRFPKIPALILRTGARDLHGGKCEGYAQVGMSKVGAEPCADCDVSRNRSNTMIYAKESGALIAEGTMRPLDATHSLTIATPNSAWHSRKLSFSTSQFFEKAGAPPEGMAPSTNGSFQVDRYDTRNTKAFWNTAVPDTMPIRSENFTSKTWANPQEAVVHLYQTEYWGIWMFQLVSCHDIR